jgi:hypothetical protein
MENLTTTPPPVRYYVGDLCYVMHDCWDEVCDLTPFDNSTHAFELVDGREFILFSTAYGDGQYNDQSGKSYAVDSGTIGAIRVEDIRDLVGFASTIEGGYGHIVDFPAEIDGFDCFYENGLIHIYNVVIDTGSEVEEYDEFDEDNEEDA